MATMILKAFFVGFEIGFVVVVIKQIIEHLTKK